MKGGKETGEKGREGERGADKATSMSTLALWRLTMLQLPMSPSIENLTAFLGAEMVIVSPMVDRSRMMRWNSVADILIEALYSVSGMPRCSLSMSMSFISQSDCGTRTRGRDAAVASEVLEVVVAHDQRNKGDVASVHRLSRSGAHTRINSHRHEKKGDGWSAPSRLPAEAHNAQRRSTSKSQPHARPGRTVLESASQGRHAIAISAEVCSKHPRRKFSPCVCVCVYVCVCV